MIRIARETDIPEMLAIYAPYVQNTTYSFEYEPPTAGEFADRFRAVTCRFPWLVWEEEGRILGYAYGSAPFQRAAYRWCAEDSVYLLPEATGRGIGKKLCLALERILRYQGYRQIYALVTSENTGSVAFHEALGYRRCGLFPGCGFKFGRWLDVIWLYKELESVEFPSKFPVSWDAVIQDDQTFFDILDILSLS